MKNLAQRQAIFHMKFSQAGYQQGIVAWACIELLFYVFNRVQQTHITGVLQKTHDIPITNRVY